MRKVLLTPGPCMTSDTVRLASALPDLNHRDPEFLTLVQETKSRLLSVYPDTQAGWHPYLLGGSGTLAVESMISSCVPPNQSVLVLENGYYSGRIRDILKVHGITFQSIEHDWLSAWNFELIEESLKQGCFAVLGTHNETTTGRLNDISRLGKLCHQYGAYCFIDAMSSFGADPIDFTHIDVVCASANKCLHGIPGVAFVLVKDGELRESLKDIAPRSYYMNLPMYEGDQPPLTPPVPALQAFRQALREYPASGASARFDDYMSKANFVRKALLERGFQPAIPIDETSSTLTTVSLPEGHTYESWFDANREAGFILYGCKGELHNRFFQVSQMGETSLSDFEGWISAVDTILGY